MMTVAQAISFIRTCAEYDAETATEPDPEFILRCAYIEDLGSGEEAVAVLGHDAAVAEYLLEYERFRSARIK